MALEDKGSESGDQSAGTATISTPSTMARLMPSDKSAQEGARTALAATNPATTQPERTLESLTVQERLAQAKAGLQRERSGKIDHKNSSKNIKHTRCFIRTKS